jgi:hypothetical protein
MVAGVLCFVFLRSDRGLVGLQLNIVWQCYEYTLESSMVVRNGMWLVGNTTWELKCC